MFSKELYKRQEFAANKAAIQELDFKHRRPRAWRNWPYIHFLKRGYSFLRRTVFKRLITELAIHLYSARVDIAGETMPRFANTPRNVTIELPRRISNPERMILGDDIHLGPGSLLIAITHYPTRTMRHPKRKHAPPLQTFNPKIVIGHRVTSTANLQIAAMSEVIIEDDVMFASNINITDGLHGYETANIPYKYQKMCRIAPIKIKQGCWIGQNAVILPGVTIGQFSIIGANSVVTNSIPDRCIAVGAPAKVIKKWDESTQSWLPHHNINHEESFL